MSTETITPKKPSLKKILAIISTVLILVLGTNHITVQLGYAELGISVTDSTAVISVTPVDSLPVTDTLKLDTLKK